MVELLVLDWTLQAIAGGSPECGDRGNRRVKSAGRGVCGCRGRVKTLAALAETFATNNGRVLTWMQERMVGRRREIEAGFVAQ